MILKLHSLSIFAFSDTHGCHRDLRVPEKTDILICAGDVVEDNLLGDEYDDFIECFSSFPAKWKLFVPGNHELSFELGQSEKIEKAMSEKGIQVLQNAVYDCDGVIIGSIDADSSIADENIPTDLDILVTHYPPYGILDDDMGSIEILNFVMKSQPSLHLFGHIHSAKGQKYQFGKTLCINIVT